VEWVLIMSVQWVVGGSATAPTTHTIVQFQTEDSCKTAAQEIKNEMKATIQCVNRRAKKGSDATLVQHGLKETPHSAPISLA
jgi:hypothetical protein